MTNFSVDVPLRVGRYTVPAEGVLTGHAVRAWEGGLAPRILAVEVELDLHSSGPTVIWVPLKSLDLPREKYEVIARFLLDAEMDRLREPSYDEGEDY